MKYENGRQQASTSVAVGFSFAIPYGRMGTVIRLKYEKNAGKYIMKKWITFLILFLSISTSIAISVAMWIARKKPASVAIIRGADGPTSIFLAGKVGRKAGSKNG